jgi:hypothetical protein
MAQPGNFNFAAVGYSVAIWQNFADQPQRPIVNPGAEHPDLLFGQNDPNFGVAAFADGDPLYAYACNGSNLSVPCVLGRVALENVLEVSTWTFYAGNGNWSGNLNAAVPVLRCGSDHECVGERLSANLGRGLRRTLLPTCHDAHVAEARGSTVTRADSF